MNGSKQKNNLFFEKNTDFEFRKIDGLQALLISRTIYDRRFLITSTLVKKTRAIG